MSKTLLTGFFLLYLSSRLLSQSCSLKLYGNAEDMQSSRTVDYTFYVDSDRNELQSDTAYKVFFALMPKEGTPLKGKSFTFKIVDLKNRIAGETHIDNGTEKGLTGSLLVRRGNFKIRVYDENNKFLTESNPLEVSFSPVIQSEVEEIKMLNSHELLAEFDIKSGDSASFAFEKPVSGLYLTVQNTSAGGSTDDIYVMLDFGSDVKQVAVTNIKSSRSMNIITVDKRERTYEVLCSNAKGITILTRKSDNLNTIKLTLRVE